jgi:hypothetical protein
MPTLYWGPWLAKNRRGGPAGGWLILKDRLKNWVVECVASEVNEFNT